MRTMRTVSRSIVFETWEDKAAYLDGVAWDDARLPLTRDVARRCALACSVNRPDLIAHQIFRFVRDVVRYMPDPASEEFSDSDAVLRQGYGDCDDKVRVFVALCRSVRIEARVAPVLRRREGAPDFCHVQAEVRWPGSYQEPMAGPGGWIVAELILRDAELGQEPQHVRSPALA